MPFVLPGAKSALKQCCVPLDVNYSLRLLREALGDSQYTARALNHSRQLLSLYLAGQTSGRSSLSCGTELSEVLSTSQDIPQLGPLYLTGQISCRSSLPHWTFLR